MKDVEPLVMDGTSKNYMDYIFEELTKEPIWMKWLKGKYK